MNTIQGNCLCGEVIFKVETPTHLDSCHCEQCRRWTGSVSISLDFTEVTFENEKGLKWFRSSEWAERGFCQNCGSSLFYRLIQDPTKMSICVGSLDILSGEIQITKEFFIDQKPDYYNFEGEREKLTGKEVFALYGADQE